MSRHIFIFLLKKLMKLFNTLLEIKTTKKNPILKSVFIENSLYWTEWAYFIYHYDMQTHSFYINDLDYFWTKDRTSAIDIIENIITKAFHQEMLWLPCCLSKTQIKKKPKVYVFYRKKDWLLIIDKVTLQAIRADEKNIIKFTNNKFNHNDSNNMKLVKIKKSISDFYENTSIK
jgi:hypothetical protein